MKKLMSLLLAVVLTLGCLGGLCFAADPLAEVTNGTETVQANSSKEIKSLINSDGTTVVKMLRDYTGESFLVNVPTVTVDLDGHTMTVTADDGLFLAVDTVGTKNHITTLKNGIVTSYDHALEVREGAAHMENIISCSFGAPLGLFQTEDKWNDDNKVIGCTLASEGWHTVVFNSTEDQTGISFSIENTTLLSYKPNSKDYCIGRRSSAGAVVVGENVELYSTNPAGGYHSDVVLLGKSLNYVGAKQSLSIPEFGLNETGLFYWSSSKEGDGSQTTSGSSDPIAVVINGTEEIEVSSHNEIVPFINADGTTVIKMLKDYTADGSPFLNNITTVTLDLNGHTVGSTTNNAVTVKYAGTSNSTTVIKNGFLFAYNSAVRIYEGGLKLDNVKAMSDSNYCISFSQLDPKWNSDNLITGGSVLVSMIHQPICYNYADQNMSAISVKVENASLVAGKSGGTFIVGSNKTTPGTTILGKGVKLYTYNVRLVNPTTYKLIGEATTQTAKNTASIAIPELGVDFTKIHCWETAAWDGPTTPATPEVEVKDFADVAKDFWGYEAIMNAAKAGLVQGKSENADGTMNYVPNAAMTRAEFITVITRYFYPTEAAAVTAGAKWWSGYYDLAIQKGILQAAELEGGAMDKAMSREEMALVLSRTAPAQTAYESVTLADAAAIPDYASVDEYYQTAVLWAYGAGLLKGVDTAGTFNPKGELNRAAVATIFNTLLSSK